MELNIQKVEFAKNYLLKITNKNLKNWVNLFPDASSINYQYPRVNNYLPEAGWTSGFWTGILWNAFLITKDLKFKKMAEYHLTSFRHRLRENVMIDHHDLGFLYIPSALTQWQLTKNEKAKETVIWAADKLLTRFNSQGNYFQAWGVMNDPQSARLIIDCNLNVPLLFKVSELTKNEVYKNAALMHLNNAVNLLIRDDGSTFHTYYFDSQTGLPTNGETAQGFSNNSCWARGQAWAVYGFILAYKSTNDCRFLDAYFKTALYFINHLPKNKVPFWDLIFNEISNEERDTSAAAIFINGIIEASELNLQSKEQKVLEVIASEMFDNLVDDYLTTEIKDAEGFLKESVYNKKSNSGINEATIWGDYFFFQIVTRVLSKDWINVWI